MSTSKKQIKTNGKNAKYNAGADVDAPRRTGHKMRIGKPTASGWATGSVRKGFLPAQ